MIEDALALLESEGFVVSNVFQCCDTSAPFGPSGEWQVHLRNHRNVRSGSGKGRGLEVALRAAFATAMQGPTHDKAKWPEPSDRSEARRTLPPPTRAPVLSPADAEQGELF